MAVPHRVSVIFVVALSFETTAQRAIAADETIDAKKDASAAAEALFVEGKHLVAEGRYADGCAKLDQSLKLEAAVGTEINLADCYEKTGRIASAWMAFHEAVALAEREHRPDWADLARQRARILEPAVPQLTLVVDEPAPGLEILRDGVLVDPSTYGLSVPLDPGAFSIVASAPGRRSFTGRVVVEKSFRVVLHVPALASDGTTLAVPPATRDRPGQGRGPGTVQRTAALAIGAMGLAAIAVGSVAGVAAIVDNRNAADRCPTSPRCTDAGAVALTEDARRAADVSTVAFVAGATLLGSAALLFFTAPHARAGARAGIGLVPTGLVIAGSW